ncbi:Transcriptional regulator, MerR family [Pseudomonas sp. R2-37-08W]|uniref:MerR family transcriptional regulator n=1 Tax=unclassified Pseudomonas TaxID=196821 RepID=UPI000F5706FF|nr:MULTISPECIES: MerR family transcriptional regulator [unclassified Pseudomonas]AZF12527.1 Transcriptional regulator, MerR family [Pseudomonas sp. R2-37-08W]AZF49518.1 Transcriptional regulator, MerR family [Pseudomonas sp. R2-7-07]AZF60006.1 Transcriptional regulator, MerR family [Pseudomonas sp. R11-23-07]
MKIGEVAAHMGVSVDALRFYEEKGLIKPLRAANGYRFYPEQTLQLVGYIKLAQQLGFSLREIGENLPLLWESEGASDDLLTQLFEEKIALLDERIGQMQTLRNLLAEQAVQICPLMGTRPAASA